MAKAAKKTLDAKIVSVLKKGPRKGLTAAEIAARGELNINSTRTTLGLLVDFGSVAVVGTAPVVGFGRPSNRYSLSA